MKYFIFLSLILGLGGCQKRTVIFERSLEVVEENQELTDGDKDKDDGRTGTDYEDLMPSDELLVTSDGGDLESEEQDFSDDIVIPENFDVPVPFGTQSPFAVWDELHNEACEEAAMIMAVRYLRGEKLDKQVMEDEILAMVKWEEDNGYGVDLTAAEAVAIFRDYFGLKARVEGEVTVRKIKRELARGNLVISPHIGWELNNPYYREASSYHFLVIRGWTKEQFITNDNGTRRGEGYKYDYETIINSMHDFNGGDVKRGERVMIVVGL